MLNGSGFYGSATPHVGINFAPDVNGVGVTSSIGDGGTVQIFDGLDGMGTMLGSVPFSANFGGITSTDQIRSVIFTCEFDADGKCGLIDPTFGTVSNVSIPTAAWLFGSALLGLGVLKRKKA